MARRSVDYPSVDPVTRVGSSPTDYAAHPVAPRLPVESATCHGRCASAAPSRFERGTRPDGDPRRPPLGCGRADDDLLPDTSERMRL
jgi:hypothetical protein